MNQLHLYLWAYWDVTDYYCWVALLLGAFAVMYAGIYLFNREWPRRRKAKIATYTVFAVGLPGFMLFNSMAAERILVKGPGSLESHIQQLNRDAIYHRMRAVVQEQLPPSAGADKVVQAIFADLCSYVHEKSVRQKHALPFPFGIPAKAEPQNAELKAYLYDHIFRNRSYPAQLDTELTRQRAIEINREVTRFLTRIAWEQNETELRSAANPPCLFFILWFSSFLAYAIIYAYHDIKNIDAWR